MPRRDGTGPNGDGPLTGRGLGAHGKKLPFEQTQPPRNGMRKSGNKPQRNNDTQGE